MINYSKSQLYQHETECYGCERKTTNMSGMCDDCGVEVESDAERPVRTAHTPRQAFNMIERGG